jgi:hypothetical protein
MLLQHIKTGVDDPSATGFSSENLQLMLDSFNTYWPKLEESSLIAMMIDPRFKLDIISNKSKKKDAREQLEKVFKKYEKRILESTKTQATSSSTASTTLSSSSSPSSSKSNAKQSTPTQTIVNKIKEKITPLSLRFFNESNSKPSQKN